MFILCKYVDLCSHALCMWVCVCVCVDICVTSRASICISRACVYVYLVSTLDTFYIHVLWGIESSPGCPCPRVPSPRPSPSPDGFKSEPWKRGSRPSPGRTCKMKLKYNWNKISGGGRPSCFVSVSFQLLAHVKHNAKASSKVGAACQVDLAVDLIVVPAATRLPAWEGAQMSASLAVSL